MSGPGRERIAGNEVLRRRRRGVGGTGGGGCGEGGIAEAVLPVGVDGRRRAVGEAGSMGGGGWIEEEEGEGSMLPCRPWID